AGHNTRGVPEGHDENSPAFERRDNDKRRTSPEGTTESKMKLALEFQPSLRDSNPSNRVPGVETPGYFQGVPPGHAGSWSGFVELHIVPCSRDPDAHRNFLNVWKQHGASPLIPPHEPAVGGPQMPNE